MWSFTHAATIDMTLALAALPILVCSSCSSIGRTNQILVTSDASAVLLIAKLGCPADPFVGDKILFAVLYCAATPISQWGQATHQYASWVLCTYDMTAWIAI